MYRLNVHTLRMDRLQATGEAPGRIYEHRAASVPHGVRVCGGSVARQKDDKESHEQNLDSFVLDLERLRWHRESMPGPQERVKLSDCE